MTGQGETTVLVVDDDSNLAELYTAFLETKYTVRTATSGSEALEKCDDTVDVVLLDRRMPAMSGDDVLAEIRNRGLDVQVAMLTAVEPNSEIVEMQFDDYKVKPVDKSDLFGTVETMVKRATYDERSQELFRLASKKATLEVANNQNSEEYEQLVARLQTVREELDETLDELMEGGVI